MVDILRLYKIPILLGSISLLTISISLVLLVKSFQPTTPIEFSQNQEATGSALGQSTIAVDVEGGVVTPGFYTLAIGARVEDAITAAGGFSPNADLEQIAKSINRAAKLTDGGKLYIPKIGDAIEAPSTLASGVVNINLASKSDLEGLSGIGPVTADKIIANRPYQTLDELVTKKAIGQALFDKIKSNLAL